MKGLLAKIQVKELGNPKDEGYLNVWEIQKRDGPNLSVTRIRALLSLGVSQGVLEKKKFRIKIEGKNRKTKCQTLIPADISPELGIEARSFDTTIETMNQIQEAIIWSQE